MAWFPTAVGNHRVPLLAIFQSGLPGLIAALLLMVLVITTRSARSGNSPNTRVVLIRLAVVLALIVSGASILADFWIFPRQWIASQALVLAALPWLASTVLTTEQPGQRIRRVTLVVSVLILAPTVISTAMWKASQLREWRTAWSTSPFSELSESELARTLDEGAFPSNRVWMEFSQANLVQGGDVWSSLGRFYTDRDWSDITLRQLPREELFLE